MIFSGIVTLAILPFGNVQDGLGLYGIDVSIGVLYFFAFGSLSFYGLLLAGWSSGSKYSFLGAMRSAAQLISYEVSMGLSLLGVVMMTGSLSLTHVVDGQGEIWNVIPQIIGFLIFMVAGFAETSRAPFDLPEADAELVQGYMTEYGGMQASAPICSPSTWRCSWSRASPSPSSSAAGWDRAPAGSIRSGWW